MPDSPARREINTRARFVEMPVFHRSDSPTLLRFRWYRGQRRTMIA
jgi:hypothetical protein